ncbi:MAG: hypothetical protein CMH94_01165 [Oceanicaulis sp.]|uniref:Uncharacterized protein n=1 Tax=Maricaulis virginensis TaxID=144022 RepID=A0A9W6MP27_9PROT|nr:hypothetical protein [Maricaulis virginensis]MAC38290.1 hypothetical protein [Oceanicaulis sp.]MAZ91111.1 hypothetical protein [Maricaulis sp.]MBI74199.1 hypothetical protein [Oceanicaulis sp.]GLK52723.1 hypothetical protein GCM10017621_22310 [Maricaulis virginensis]|tara:strand:+ start:109 stop:558 length:450 start_codon:yes stop_codon:yes gene_type:complete
MTEISKLVRMRNRCLGLAALSFLVWQLMQGLEDVLPESSVAFGVILVTGLVGIGGFVAAMLVFLVYAGKVTETRTQAVIEDELFAHNQARAVRFGYIALMVLVAGGYGASSFVDIPSGHMIRVLMVTGVCVPIFAFLWLDRASGEEEGE